MFYFLTVDVPNWTVPFDMPEIPLTVDMMDILWNSLKISIKSIGSAGIILFGVLGSLLLIGTIFNVAIRSAGELKKAVDRKEFNRRVEGADFERNYDSIIESGLLKNSIRRHIHINDMLRSSGSIIEEKNLARGLSLDADIKFKTENMHKIVKARVIDREISRRTNDVDVMLNRLDVVEDKVLSREVGTEATDVFRSRHGEVQRDSLTRVKKYYSRRGYQ